MASMSEALSFPEGLKAAIRHASLHRLRQHCACDTIEPCDTINPNDLIYGHWMGLILIANSTTRILFKAHYFSDDIRALAAAALHAEPGAAHASDLAVADFMREYCNLVGGMIKSTLENNGVHAGVSLPLVTRGFDEVFEASPREVLNFEDVWSLKSDAGEIICSLRMEVMDDTTFESLNLIPSGDAPAEESSIEFL